jgi:hypothetical protein
MYGYFIVPESEYDPSGFGWGGHTICSYTEYDGEMHVIDFLGENFNTLRHLDIAGGLTHLVAIFLDKARAEQYQAMLTE